MHADEPAPHRVADFETGVCHAERLEQVILKVRTQRLAACGFVAGISDDPAWSRDLLQKYDAYWNWATLSALRQLPWDIELFSAFASRWFIPLVVEHQHFEVHAISADQIKILLPAGGHPA